MSLGKYKEKRDFDKTPEPEGKEKKGQGPLRFVIQKHEATRLHYDFRLEMEGVMKSWAIPKGPQTDPQVKRLAMATEDHPIEYNDFEGIIPKGQYGGGTVMIWDEGFYLPVGVSKVEESEKKAIEMFYKGDLKFAINGKKIKGEYALVKTKREGEDNSWLLIKHNDEYATKNDLTKLDKSARTGRTMEEIAGEAPAKKEIWNSNRDIDLDEAPKAGMPTNIKPMLATLVEKPFDDNKFIFEIKWDGYRAISEISKDKVNIYSRNGISFNEVFSRLTGSLSKSPHEMVLDGEVIVTDENGMPSFSLMQNFKRTKKGNLVYMVFDILYLDGHDLRSLPLLKRKDILEKVLPQSKNILISQHIEEKGTDFFKASKLQGLEGIVAKNKESIYEDGKRGPSWLKIKAKHEQEAIICGFTEPKGSRKYLGALVLGVYRNGELMYVGHTGGKINDALLKELRQKLDEIETTECPFTKVPPTNSPVHWVKPLLVAQITFQEWTDTNVMRIPIFEGLREDKDPKEVVMEMPEEKEIKTVLKNESNNKGETVKTYDDFEVKLSHLDKVYWPDEGYKKGDLIEYYEKIADVMLPYLIDRPESLHRYPEGIEGTTRFWQKDIDFKPEWAKTIKIHSDSEDKEIDYFLCQNKASLVYLANLGCIEINPWFSRVGSLDSPDYIAIDLDPEDIGFEKVVETALAVREVLENADIINFPKTSGSTGIHIYVPLKKGYSYDQGKQFAEIIARLVNDRLPEITSIERSPKKRQKKVYLDYLQNRAGQTLAAPYSVRPKKGATVSTPLLWSEVNKDLKIENFTIKNIFKRLDKMGDIWEGKLKEGIDISKSLESLAKTKKT